LLILTLSKHFGLVISAKLSFVKTCQDRLTWCRRKANSSVIIHIRGSIMVNILIINEHVFFLILTKNVLTHFDGTTLKQSLAL
jgi:hypothetical protein